MKSKAKGKIPCYTYILECNDNTYYTGYTPDLKRRIDRHNAGKGAKYTQGRRPVTLVWYEECKDSRSAKQEEFRIKQLTRKQKQEIIKKGR
ncbi:MAG: GIY-YIG nuclease family protein [Candidatus Omnitrophota bacterium]